MRKIVRLTESDLNKLVKRVIEEDGQEFPKFGTKEFNDLASSYFGGNPKHRIGKYDLESEDFSEIEKPAFGGGSDREHMIMRKSVRDITRKLNDLIERQSWSKKTFDTITMIDDMLKDM
jgi:hypothetical protein